MAKYLPHFETETDVSGSWIDCLWASGTMLLDKWTRGQRIIHHANLRRYSGDTGGSNVEDLQRGIRNATGWTVEVPEDANWSTLVNRYIKKDYGIVLGGLYSRLRPYAGGKFTRWDRGFANRGRFSTHSVYIQRTGPSGSFRPGYVWWMDPLGRPVWNSRVREYIPYRGEWMPMNIAMAFATGVRRANGSHFIAVAPDSGKARPALPDTSTAPKPKPKGEPMIVEGARVTSSHTVLAKAGTLIYNTSSATKAFKKLAKDVKLDYVGQVLGRPDMLVVRVATGIPFKDKKVRNVDAYVKRASVGRPTAK
jgi:hypothetical protein